MEWRTWIVAEVDAERPPDDQPGQPTSDGWTSSPAYTVEASGRDCSRRIHRIATQYAPTGNYTITATMSSTTGCHVEALRFSVPADQAVAVLAQVEREPNVRRAWFDGSYPETS